MRHLMQWRHGGRKLEIVQGEQPVAVGIVVVDIFVVELAVQKVCYSQGLS